ncbi:MAG TPA: prepilin-type N-terminal cleavage/methylation domain-containing protein [Fimbriimonadaceae bacterium]|jgi:prepilin-type N-terminal cleavage/methylation domain-containing protein/prepilin-type processing-associated H-X9-DG protein
MNKKRAFTLIELLVVIAIIAILAAILFPVFAQAKLAAKGAAALSNTKQIGLAVLMYANDYDDNGPLDITWTGGNAGPLYFGSGASAETMWPWSYVIVPYTKNTDILIDPILGSGTTGNPFGAQFQNDFNAYAAEFQYDYQLMSPIQTVAKSTYTYSSSALTSVSRPSDMVMAVESFAENELVPGPPSVVGIGTGTPDGVDINYGVDSPDCNDLPNLCWGGWGSGTIFNTKVVSFVSATGYLQGSYVNGAYTGGVAFRRNASQTTGGGLATTAFVDGHAKAMGPSQLAVGTNWYYGIAASALFKTTSAASTYRWWQY